MRRGLKHEFFFMIIFSLVPFGLISIESQEFEDFFEAQDEREMAKVREKEASIKSVSEKCILTFFILAIRHVLPTRRRMY